MKKSNKILLAGFLTLLLFITAIHITLYAKYKSGNYTLYDESENLGQSSLQLIPNILVVTIRNVPYGTVVFSDVARVEKEEKGIQYVQKGDTLQITGNNNQPGFKGPVVFHLPANAMVSLQNSSLVFRPGKTAVPGNPVIYLQKAKAYFSGTEGALKMGHLKIVATDGSTASFEGRTQVEQLEVQLSNSELQSPGGDFGQLSIDTDVQSHISLQAKTLLKAAIKTSSPQ